MTQLIAFYVALLMTSNNGIHMEHKKEWMTKHIRQCVNQTISQDELAAEESDEEIVEHCSCIVAMTLNIISVDYWMNAMTDNKTCISKQTLEATAIH